MTVIRVPVPEPPPQSAINLSRPVSSLLRTQIQHFYEAETKLPLRYRTDIYVNAIKTEGEAARYIRAVTEAIHNAHMDAGRERARRSARPKRVYEIAAAAEQSSKGKNKKSSNTRISPKRKRAK